MGLFAFLYAGAETTDSLDVVARINADSIVKVEMPDGLAALLTEHNADRAASSEDESSADMPTASKSQKKIGYKVQVFDDNNVHTAKHEAEKRVGMIRSRFPDMEVVTEFHSPYWRVKAGNFRTRSEAENALAAIRSAFPGLGSQLRVVRDRINIHN